jgi:hypothetical protein
MKLSHGMLDANVVRILAAKFKNVAMDATRSESEDLKRRENTGIDRTVKGIAIPGCTKLRWGPRTLRHSFKLAMHGDTAELQKDNPSVYCA